MPSVYVNFDMKAVQDNVNRAIGKKVERALFEDTRNEIAGEYAKAISKYVPYKTGALSRSARVVDGEIRYSAKVKRKGGTYDYAEYQYTHEFENRTTPGTYGHWNRHLTTAERKAFYEEVAEIITRKMNNG